MTTLNLNEMLLAVALEDVKAGTHMAGACVDGDGTARVELLERLAADWRNVTTGETTASIDMASKFDDLVVTHLPDVPKEPA